METFGAEDVGEFVASLLLAVLGGYLLAGGAKLLKAPTLVQFIAASVGVVLISLVIPAGGPTPENWVGGLVAIAFSVGAI